MNQAKKIIPAADFRNDEDLKVRLVVDGKEYEVPAVTSDPSFLSRVPLESLPLDIPLPCPLYAMLGERYVLFRRPADTISGERVKTFDAIGTEAVFIPKICWPMFLETIETYRMPGAPESEERIRHLRVLLMAHAEEIRQRLCAPRRHIFETLRGYIERLAEEIRQAPALALTHLRHDMNPRFYFANHTVNTAIYGTLIAVSLKFSDQDIKQIAYGCLLHDIGNLFIPREILNKAGSLTSDEFAQIKNHTILGAEILQSVGVPAGVTAAALQHHERMDGKGYPNGVKGKEIHPFAKICAIADVYDAITSNRPHQQGLSGKEAIHRMRSEEGLFDQEFLSKLSFE